jgi:dihydrofolate reductase
MRTVTYGAACSADGFIAAADGSYDWIRFSKDAESIMTDFWRRNDTVLMGRKTWDVAKGQKGGGMPGVHSYVFSRTLDNIKRKGVTLVKDDAAEFVRELKERPGKDICVFGGGALARSLFAAGVIDEIGINVQPVMLGAGIPLFVDAGRRVDLELKECRAIAKDCIYVVYAVKH